MGASVAIGGVAAAGLGLFLLNKRNANRFEHYLHQATAGDDEDENDFYLYQIAEVVFEQIKLRGFLGHITQQRVHTYVEAIKEILKELENLNFPVNLATMADKAKTHFLKEFPRQIKAAFPVLESNRVHFFKPEINPNQIKKAANHIAQSIKFVMDSIESQILDDDQDDSRDIPLTEISSRSEGRSNSLKERLFEDDRDERQEPRPSRCCVM